MTEFKPGPSKETLEEYFDIVKEIGDIVDEEEWTKVGKLMEERRSHVLRIAVTGQPGFGKSRFINKSVLPNRKGEVPMKSKSGRTDITDNLFEIRKGPKTRITIKSLHLETARSIFKAHINDLRSNEQDDSSEMKTAKEKSIESLNEALRKFEKDGAVSFDFPTLMKRVTDENIKWFKFPPIESALTKLDRKGCEKWNDLKFHEQEVLGPYLCNYFCLKIQELFGQVALAYHVTFEGSWVQLPDHMSLLDTPGWRPKHDPLLQYVHRIVDGVVLLDQARTLTDTVVKDWLSRFVFPTAPTTTTGCMIKLKSDPPILILHVPAWDGLSDDADSKIVIPAARSVLLRLSMDDTVASVKGSFDRSKRQEGFRLLCESITIVRGKEYEKDFCDIKDEVEKRALKNQNNVLALSISAFVFNIKCRLQAGKTFANTDRKKQDLLVKFKKNIDLWIGNIVEGKSLSNQAACDMSPLQSVTTVSADHIPVDLRAIFDNTYYIVEDQIEGIDLSQLDQSTANANVEAVIAGLLHYCADLFLEFLQQIFSCAWDNLALALEDLLVEHADDIDVSELYDDMNPAWKKAQQDWSWQQDDLERMETKATHLIRETVKAAFHNGNDVETIVEQINDGLWTHRTRGTNSVLSYWKEHFTKVVKPEIERLAEASTAKGPLNGSTETQNTLKHLVDNAVKFWKDNEPDDPRDIWTVDASLPVPVASKKTGKPYRAEPDTNRSPRNLDLHEIDRDNSFVSQHTATVRPGPTLQLHLSRKMREATVNHQAVMKRHLSSAHVGETRDDPIPPIIMIDCFYEQTTPVDPSSSASDYRIFRHDQDRCSHLIIVVIPSELVTEYQEALLSDEDAAAYTYLITIPSHGNQRVKPEWYIDFANVFATKFEFQQDVRMVPFLSGVTESYVFRNRPSRWTRCLRFLSNALKKESQQRQRRAFSDILKFIKPYDMLQERIFPEIDSKETKRTLYTLCSSEGSWEDNQDKLFNCIEEIKDCVLRNEIYHHANTPVVTAAIVNARVQTKQCLTMYTPSEAKFPTYFVYSNSKAQKGRSQHTVVMNNRQYGFRGQRCCWLVSDDDDFHQITPVAAPEGNSATDLMSVYGQAERNLSDKLLNCGSDCLVTPMFAHRINLRRMKPALSQNRKKRKHTDTPDDPSTQSASLPKISREGLLNVISMYAPALPARKILEQNTNKLPYNIERNDAETVRSMETRGWKVHYINKTKPAVAALEYLIRYTRGITMTGIREHVTEFFEDTQREWEKALPHVFKPESSSATLQKFRKGPIEFDFLHVFGIMYRLRLEIHWVEGTSSKRVFLGCCRQGKWKSESTFTLMLCNVNHFHAVVKPA